jgi:hypothetical protein
VAREGEMRFEYKILVEESDWKRSLRRVWEDDIKMDLNEIQCEDMDYIQLKGHGPMSGSREGGNELPGTVKSRHFFKTSATMASQEEQCSLKFSWLDVTTNRIVRQFRSRGFVTLLFCSVCTDVLMRTISCQ